MNKLNKEALRRNDWVLTLGTDGELCRHLYASPPEHCAVGGCVRAGGGCPAHVMAVRLPAAVYVDSLYLRLDLSETLQEILGIAGPRIFLHEPVVLAVQLSVLSDLLRIHPATRRPFWLRRFDVERALTLRLLSVTPPYMHGFRTRETPDTCQNI